MCLSALFLLRLLLFRLFWLLIVFFLSLFIDIFKLVGISINVLNDFSGSSMADKVIRFLFVDAKELDCGRSADAPRLSKLLVLHHINDAEFDFLVLD